MPVSQEYFPYADEVAQVLRKEGYFVEVDTSSKTLNKKIRENQLAQVESLDVKSVFGD